MIAFAVSGLVLGLALGLRFKVLVLIPVMMLTITAAGLALATGAASLDRLCCMVLWFSSSLQLGYLGVNAVPVAVLRRGVARRSTKIEA